MSSETATQTQTQPTNNSRARGRGNRGRQGHRGPPRGGGAGRRPGPKGQPAAPPPAPADAPAPPDEKTAADPSDTASTQAEEGPVCWICAEPVKYYSVSECNHRTCHVCALRLRALYKKTDCTFCKVSPVPHPPRSRRA